uniref:BPTI/Kunitz inhibitor domain-containing protein n=1 Tax=Salvator merianae TaxID=96440 RepID=A0A8D0BQE5_SALMN
MFLESAPYWLHLDSIKRLFHEQDLPPRCKLRKARGWCRKKVVRFYYDRYNKRCREFQYGGCNGNRNNFDTLEDCNRECGRIDSRPSRCEEPLDSGRCTLPMLAYYFNVSSGLCEEFISGGCGSNNNNFLHLEDLPMPRKCTCQKSPGYCFKAIPRYFYNPKSNKCEQFLYSGCSGNGNRFVKKADCIRECKSYGNSLNKRVLSCTPHSQMLHFCLIIIHTLILYQSLGYSP